MKRLEINKALKGMQTNHGFLSILVVSFFSASMLSGGILVTSLDNRDYMIGAFIGILILGIYIGLLAYIAVRTGLSTHLLAKYSFGEKGSYLVSFLLGATQVGWFGIGIVMFAVSGFSDTVPREGMGMSAAIAISVGSFISAGILTPEFIRFSKNKKVAVATLVAFLIGNALMFGFGAIGIGQADIAGGMFLKGLIVLATIVLGLLNTWIPGIGGIIIADYFILRKGKYMSIEKMIFTSVNKIAIVAWLLGVAAAYLLPGIPPVNSAIVAMITYVSLTKIAKIMRTELGMQNSL